MKRLTSHRPSTGDIAFRSIVPSIGHKSASNEESIDKGSICLQGVLWGRWGCWVATLDTDNMLRKSLDCCEQVRAARCACFCPLHLHPPLLHSVNVQWLLYFRDWPCDLHWPSVAPNLSSNLKVSHFEIQIWTLLVKLRLLVRTTLPISRLQEVPNVDDVKEGVSGEWKWAPLAAPANSWQSRDCGSVLPELASWLGSNQFCSEIGSTALKIEMMSFVTTLKTSK